MRLERFQQGRLHVFTSSPTAATSATTFSRVSTRAMAVAVAPLPPPVPLVALPIVSPLSPFPSRVFTVLCCTVLFSSFAAQYLNTPEGETGAECLEKTLCCEEASAKLSGTMSQSLPLQEVRVPSMQLPLCWNVCGRARSLIAPSSLPAPDRRTPVQSQGLPCHPRRASREPNLKSLSLTLIRTRHEGSGCYLTSFDV